MAWLDDFAEEMNTTVVITGKGNMSSVGADGQPVYGTAITKYSGLCAFWQLSASEVYQYDRIGNPSTHQIIIDPLKVSITIQNDDIATIGSVEYKITTPDNVLSLNDVMTFTVSVQK